MMNTNTRQTVTTYRWNGYGWDTWSKRVVMPMDRPATYDKSNPKPAKRYRPCIWNNGEIEISALECPEGFVKGRLPENRASFKRLKPCVRCGRQFYNKRTLSAHVCINPK